MTARPARLCAALVALSATQAPAVEIPSRGTDQIAHFCVVAFGGKERWQEVRDARYTQVVTRYLPGNRPKSERTAEIYLRYQPRQQCRIDSRTEDGKRQLMIFDGQNVRVEVEGREDADPMVRRRALRNALSSLYLFSLPFPLRDPGVEVTYRGQGKVDGRPVYQIQAAVRNSGSASAADRYDFFIDTETFRVPQLMYTTAADNVSYVVRWSDYANLNGLLRPLRWDYMSDAMQKAMTIEMRGLKINSNLADSLFETRAPRRSRATAPGSAAPPR